MEDKLRGKCCNLAGADMGELIGQHSGTSLSFTVYYGAKAIGQYETLEKANIAATALRTAGLYAEVYRRTTENMRIS